MNKEIKAWHESNKAAWETMGEAVGFTIDALQEALEAHWDAVANNEASPTYESIFDYAADLQELGIGAVALKTMQGRPGWLCLESMQF